MLFADADSLRISPREARSLIEQAEKRQKDAQNADKKAADMLAEYERRKGILNTRLSELEKKGGAALAVLDAQQAVCSSSRHGMTGPFQRPGINSVR
ncbi:hypothetical protein ABL382_004648 [Escherichia coli]|nr:hypothetical protein [Escherichia coli]EIC1153231.1 hypothetical protein [Escherichia coli]